MQKKLKETIERNNLENRPQNIFKRDETGFQTDVGIQKILCRKGSRNPHKIVGSVPKALYTVQSLSKICRKSYKRRGFR